MATIAEGAPSTRFPPLQTLAAACRRAFYAIEQTLQAERDQLPLWLPVALGAGIVAWFVLPAPAQWIAAMAGLGALGLAALAVGRFDRASRVVAVAALLAALGIGLAWMRAVSVAAPVLARPAIVTMTARVESVESLPARGLVRVMLRPVAVEPGKGRAPVALPPRVRINLKQEDAPAGLNPAASIRLQARLMPPNPPAVPGAYDFQRVAWFAGIGATGRGIAPVTVVTPGQRDAGLREALARHIEMQLPGSAGGIAAALAAGDEGAITDEDADAMRRSGLAHLLSVSGLHITAVVAATIWAMTRLLALWPWLVLRTRVPVIAAAAGACAAIGYTLLTGSQVPTARSCIAALLVLAAMAIGREAITLRLIAAGAFVVMLLWPEALMGPSFQLSFAAVAAIVALHEQPTVKRWFEKREEGWGRRVAREVASLLLTGVVVEAALSPIALYHFHRSGWYGALANIVAIPLTTFVVMPAEALALAADAVGLGAPFWWATGKALALLLWIARTVAALPGSAVMLPAMPGAAYATMIAGGLWLALWRTRLRVLGLAPVAIGAIWAAVTPAPDLLVTGDGQHLAIRTPDGHAAVLRDRTGDYARDTLAENVGADGEALLLSEQPFARCTPDACIATIERDGRRWRVLATRSLYQLPIEQLATACRAVDIVVSDRRLPRTCTPRWLRLDAPVLRRTGGVAIALPGGSITTVRGVGDRHPWQAVTAAGPGDRARFRVRRYSAQGRASVGSSRVWEDRRAPQMPETPPR